MIRNALFLCVVCALIFVFYLPSYVKMQDLHEKNRVAEKRIQELELDNARLGEEQRRLTDDPVYFEKVARERLGIIRDGEVIYKIMGPGQKMDGKDSEESASLIKKEAPDADDQSMAVKKLAGEPLKPTEKLAIKPKKSTNVADPVKKKTKAVSKKMKTSPARKTSKTSKTDKTSSTTGSKATTSSTK